MSGSAKIDPVPTESPLLWPGLALLVIAVACFTIYWDGHRSQFPYSTAHAKANWPPPPEPLAATSTASGSLTPMKLPDGTELQVAEAGIENKLTAFILDTSKPVDTTTWFDFDRLLFDTGKATLQPASEQQLQNVATILKTFPKVHARIGGYTDNTGDPAANLQLSQQRATNVMNEIVKLGIPANRLDAKGYGPEHPVADNTTEEGRAQNRRISLRVTEK